MLKGNKLTRNDLNITNINIRSVSERQQSTLVTFGLLKSIEYRDNLYRELKNTPIHSEDYMNKRINLRTYNRIINRSRVM